MQLEWLKLTSLVVVVGGIIAALIAVRSFKIFSSHDGRGKSMVSTLLTSIALLVTLGVSVYQYATERHPINDEPAGIAIRRPAEIVITDISPHFGGPDQLGVIDGVSTGCKGCAVLVYARSKSGTWFLQGDPASPVIPVDASGKWQATVHLGSQYAAVLVRTPVSGVPAQTSILPTAADGVVAISAITPKQNPSQ